MAHVPDHPSSRDLRRRRQKLLASLILVPFAWALGPMLRRVRLQAEPAPIPVPPDVPAGLSVVGEAVVHRGPDGTVRAYAARCTHLGCRLDRVVEGEIVCACHGSRFAADGRATRGPARQPLAPLRVNADAQTGGWTVHAD
jgi:Rieske Fe-S protein